MQAHDASAQAGGFGTHWIDGDGALIWSVTHTNPAALQSSQEETCVHSAVATQPAVGQPST